MNDTNNTNNINNIKNTNSTTWSKPLKIPKPTLAEVLTSNVMEIIKKHDLVDLLVKLNTKEEEKYNWPIVPLHISTRLAVRTIKRTEKAIHKEIEQILKKHQFKEQA